MQVKIDSTDLGIGKLKADLATLAASRVTIGWQGASGAEVHPDSNVTMATLAKFHEFGTVRMPARPAVRITYDRHASEFRDTLRASTARMIDRQSDVDVELRSVGQFMVDKLRETILAAAEWARPLAQSTIDAKGHSLPLIDTDAYYDAASFAIRSAGPDGSVSTAIRYQGGEQR